MSNTTTREFFAGQQSPPLLRRCRCGSAFPVQRIKESVALLLVLVWLPAVSCCLIDASGLLGKQECCSKAHSHRPSVPGNCDQPCGELSSTFYLAQESQVIVLAPMAVPLFDATFPPIEIHRPTWIGRKLPAAAPPELAGHWQFFFRTALSPRAPSFAS